jgi:hypothetical protein
MTAGRRQHDYYWHTLFCVGFTIDEPLHAVRQMRHGGAIRIEKRNEVHHGVLYHSGLPHQRCEALGRVPELQSALRGNTGSELIAQQIEDVEFKENDNGKW